MSRRSEPARAGTKLDSKSKATREAMLEAGRRLLLDQPASGVFSHLTASRIAATAGRTTGALFHQWPTLDDYIDDLLARLFEPSQSRTFAEFISRVEGTAQQGGTLAEGIVVAAGEALGVLAEDPHSVAELLIWNRATRDPEFRARMAGLYPPLDEAGGQFIEQLLAATGREVRPPYTAQTLAAACSAILQGLAIRAVITPGFYPADVAGQILLTLVPLFTREPGDTDDGAAYAARTGNQLVPTQTAPPDTTPSAV